MYVIDSDVFIDAKNRHYGFDIVPAFWAWIEQQHRAGRIFTVQRVADEVLAGADELADWMDAQPASFRLSAGPEDQPSLRPSANGQPVPATIRLRWRRSFRPLTISSSHRLSHADALSSRKRFPTP
jgi:Domain of unknown function (DUF4411)